MDGKIKRKGTEGRERTERGGHWRSTYTRRAAGTWGLRPARRNGGSVRWLAGTGGRALRGSRNNHGAATGAAVAPLVAVPAEEGQGGQGKGQVDAQPAQQHGGAQRQRSK